MPEILLHYIWMKRLFLVMEQFTTDGRRVEVINVGQHNTDSGPDFTNAVIRIDGVVWTGNVEIHVKSSDWYRHDHQSDTAYDNIILHVVKQVDKVVYNSRGEAIPQCCLRYPANAEYLEQMVRDRSSVCAQRLSENPSLLQPNWKHTLLMERLECKREAIGELLTATHGAWEQAFYVTLAHNFGFHTNGLPFELLARQLPLAYLGKHRDSLFQLEAMLFGVSGLLSAQTATDDYSRRLFTEYQFLAKKFSLSSIDASLWKTLRMRPQNFPHVRIAQFAALLHQSESLFAATMAEHDVSKLRDMFAVAPSAYWQTHYRLGSELNGASRSAALGKSSIDILLINTVAPYQYAWAISQRADCPGDEALTLLQSIPAEKNHIVDQWKLLGMKIKNAADSQAYLHLYQEYCIRHRCPQCDIGLEIFTIERAH